MPKYGLSSITSCPKPGDSQYNTIPILLDIFNTEVERNKIVPAVLGGNFELPPNLPMENLGGNSKLPPKFSNLIKLVKMSRSMHYTLFLLKNLLIHLWLSAYTVVPLNLQIRQKREKTYGFVIPKAPIQANIPPSRFRTFEKPACCNNCCAIPLRFPERQ